MKYILLYLLGLPAIANNYWEKCPASVQKSIPPEVMRVDCDELEITRALLSQTPSVSNVLYHFGEYENFKKNFKEGTIPEKDWEDHIMGGNGRYKLSPPRRGLYGTTTLDVNSYSDKTNSWMMEIHFRPDCLKPEHVATLSKLYEDKRFQTWFKKTGDLPIRKLEEFETRCYTSDTMPNGFGMMSGEITIPECENIFSRFLKENSIQVVQDHLIPKSFYIRDRSCIKNILGTPEQVLQILADRPYLWMSSCSDRPEQVSSKMNGLFTVLLQALKNTTFEVKAEVYTRLKENIGMLRDAEHPEYRERWNSLLDAHAYCQKHGKMPEFRGLKDLSSYKIKLDPKALCKG